MKKMTIAFLCLVCIWGGAGWAQIDEKYIEEKYADFEKEFASGTADINTNAGEISANKQENEKKAAPIALDTAKIAEKKTAAAPEQGTAPAAGQKNAATPAELASADSLAENSSDSLTAEDDDDNDREEITADDTETLAHADSATAESSIEETLDFSTWINPACKPVFTTSPYSIRKGRLHRGVDVKVATGDSIVAAAPGKVIISKYNKGGYGHYIVIRHDNGTQTVYGHLSKRLKKVGDTAEQGELIGFGGNTGRSTGSHLHFEIRYGDINIDPSTVMNFQEGKLLDNVDKYSIAEATASHNAIQKELSKHRVHRIRPGDTLGKLALKYGTTVDKICKLNKIDRNSILKIGKLLQIS